MDRAVLATNSEKELSASEIETAKKREGYLLDLIDQYMKFLDLWEETREKLIEEDGRDIIEEILGLNFIETQKFIDEKLVVLAEDINYEIKQEKLAVIGDSSFVDTVNNTTSVWINGGTKIINSIGRGEMKSWSDAKKPEWKQYAEGLKASFSILPIYLDELCKNKKKLEIELTTHDGFLGEYKNYIFDITTMSGSKKLPYFIFFSQLEKGEINQVNIESALDKLDGKMVNKDLIRGDMDSFKK